MITYLVGNVFQYLTYRTILIHSVNNLGLFGKGFAKSLHSRFPDNTRAYKKWAAEHNKDIPQGQVLCVRQNFEGKNIWIANAVAQLGVISVTNPRPFKEVSLAECLKCVANFAHPKDEIFMPRICAGLSGGKWVEIEPIIEKHLGHLNVTVFTLPHEAAQFGMRI